MAPLGEFFVCLQLNMIIKEHPQKWHHFSERLPSVCSHPIADPNTYRQNPSLQPGVQLIGTPSHWHVTILCLQDQCIMQYYT